MMFIHTKESAAMKICKLLTGDNSLVSNSKMLQFVDPIIIALSVSVFVTVAVQLLHKKQMPKEHIDQCFEGVK